MTSPIIPKLKDPLEYLPYEVWLECIRLVISNDPAGPLSVLEVSQSWMRNLIDSTEIWTTIHLDGGHDQRARVETFLFLSNPSYINLVVQSTYGDVSKILTEIVKRASHRIRGFIFGRGVTPDGVATMLKEVIAQWGSGCFTNVISIEIATYEVWDPMVPQVLSACPNLQVLKGVNVPMWDLASLPRSMKTVSIASGPTDMWPSLDCRTYSLREVNLVLDAPAEIERRLVFPSMPLRRLMIGWGPGAVAQFRAFARNSCPSLTRLELDIYWHDIAFVIPHLSSWPCLRFLYLELDHQSNPPSGWTAPSIHHADMGHIHHFVLLMTGPSLSNPKYIEDVLHMFTEHSPLRTLKQMRLRVTRDRFPRALALRFLESLASVESLVIRLALRKEDYVGKVLLPNLTFLQLDESELLRYIEAPRLIHLKASSETTLGHPIIALPESLRSLVIQSHIFWDHCHRLTSGHSQESWPELHKVKWLPHSVATVPNLPYMSALVEVSFGREKQGPIYTELADRACDEFLQELLRHPDACSRLTTIKSACYPQWDLLLSVVHKRKANQNGRRFERIYLPAYPQIAILKNLVSCLGVADTAGPDAMQEFAYFDAMVLLRRGSIHLLRRACLCCIKAGYVGCRPIGAGTLLEQKPLQIYNRLGTPVEIQPQLSTVLDSKPPKNVRKGTDESKHRLGVCRRHNFKDLVHISAYTLVGLTFDDL